MGLFKRKKKDKAGEKEKNCFKCGKAVKEGGYTKANNRFCCKQCCSDQSKKDGTCEFC